MFPASSGWLSVPVAILVPFLMAGGAEEGPPKPAPTTDRVGFPGNYATQFVVLRTVDRGASTVVTIYGNEAAARVKSLDDLPFPDGSVLVMETAEVALDTTGHKVLDAAGAVKKEKVSGLHVMKRGPDFGAAYGTHRAGNWEFVEYRPDKSYITTPDRSAACVECHVKAGKEHDFVFRARLPEGK